MVGATFQVAAAAEVLRSKKGITAVGNAQVDTAQSKFGGASALFDGTGDYVRSPAGSQWDFGTSSFTIEYWIRFNVAPTLYVPIALRTSASILNGEWWCEITNAEKKMYWGFKNQAGTQFYVNLALAGTAFATGQWYHIALVNNAGTAQMYVDGTATGATTALSGSFGISTTDLWVGAGAGAYSVNGWMDEIRISNTARYTANFTPSTTAFVNDENTLLLLHMDGTDASTYFEDDNGIRSKKSIIAVGNAQVDTAQSKFGGSSLYLLNNWAGSSAVGSLNVGSRTGDFTFGTGNFTGECWIRLTNTSTSYLILDMLEPTDLNQGWLVYTNGTSLIYYENSANRVTATSAVSATTWHHIAVVRSSGNVQMYVDGVAVGSTYSSSDNHQELTLGIGQRYGEAGSSNFNGHIDEVRISNTARYTSNFTAPTAPFVNDANTLLLIHADGTDAVTYFEDDNGVRAKKGIVAIGNAQVDTAQSKFGGASALFDGSGDYLTSPSNSDFSFDEYTNYTIEMWVRAATGTLTGVKPLMSRLTRGTGNGWMLYANGTGINFIGANGGLTVYQSSQGYLSENTWNHIALVKNATNIKIFIDGTARVDTTYVDRNHSETAQLEIAYGAGWSGSWSGDFYWNGHLDEIRISNTARYTANFTAPTAPFQNDSNTLLLIHCDGTDASTVFTDDNGVPPDWEY